MMHSNNWKNRKNLCKWSLVLGTSVATVFACGDDSGVATEGATEGMTMGTSGDSMSSSGTTGTTTGTTSAGSGSGSESEGTTGTSSGTTAGETSSTGEPMGVCGDGVIDPGEECDDGNIDNGDSCVEGCKSAICGDGFVGDGEACDDGNTIDDDGCTNACALPSCGDGELQAGEICDDGNADDSDSCLSTCVEASCGDGFTWEGVEACDDANDDESDACTSLCEAPTCEDGIQSGDESDVDCGGQSCSKCQLGESCITGQDCESGACAGDVCILPASCKAIKDAQPDAEDGLYELDPDGDGPLDAISAYCEMTLDGGGWTLVMRFAPAEGQFHFYSPHWTTESLVNENVSDPSDPSDGKFVAYNEVVGGEIRGCLQHPITKKYACRDYPLPEPTTPLSLFKDTPVGSDSKMKGLYFAEEDGQKLYWLINQGRTINEASSKTNNYIEVGINIDDDLSCYDARVRFGLVLNNENTIITLNDAAGFGAQAYYTSSCDLPDGTDSPWKTACGFAAGSKQYHTAGHIWIR